MTSLDILVIAEAKLIRLGYILWCFEGKTDTYISCEDIDTQFLHFQGQKSKSQRKQKTVREIGHLGSQGYFSYFLGYSALIELKFYR